MKKPRIKIVDVHPNKLGKGVSRITIHNMDQWDIREAYFEMIDALIEAYEILQEDYEYRGVDKTFLRNIEQALGKAGVEL